METAPSGTAPAAGGPAPGSAGTAVSLPIRVRVILPVLLLAAAVFTAGTAIYNAPASPVTTRIGGPVHQVMNPYLEQVWQLFGPTPSTSNSKIMLQVKAKGWQAPSKPVEIETAVDTLPRHNRVLPTKQPGTFLAFLETFQNYSNQVNQIRANIPHTQQPQALQSVATRFAPAFGELQRYLSMAAHQRYPNADILAVRATLLRVPITPFSERYEKNPPAPPTHVLIRSVWLPYVPNVASP